MSRRRRAWSNWGGTVRCQPALRSGAGTEREVEAAVRTARSRGLGLRVAGAGHSFAPLVATDGVLLDLRELSGVAGVRLDPDGPGALVRVRAGTGVGRLAVELHAMGLRLPGLGTTTAPTVAGALATGSHGGGQDPPVSRALVSARLVTGRGEAVEVAEADDGGELADSLRLHLGMLGVLTEVRLRCVPTVALMGRQSLLPLADFTADPWMGGRAGGADHVIAHWHPGGAGVRVRTLRAVRGNGAARRLRSAPRATVSRFPRRFAATEVALRPEALGPALRHLADTLAAAGYRNRVPVEIRPTAGDTAVLSPTAGAPAVWVNVAVPPCPERDRWLAAAARALMSHGGRPHWGKLHPLTWPATADLYPRHPAFSRARLTLDPDGLFATSATRRLLGDP